MGQSGSSQNRKLTPSKMNLGLRGNSGSGRNFDDAVKPKKSNSRSNTIENLAPFERDSKKNMKRKDRASS